MFRLRATVVASSISSRATIVAFTMLCGLAEPRLFVKTSVTPTASIIARTKCPLVISSVMPANTPFAFKSNSGEINEGGFNTY